MASRLPASDRWAGLDQGCQPSSAARKVYKNSTLSSISPIHSTRCLRLQPSLLYLHSLVRLRAIDSSRWSILSASSVSRVQPLPCDGYSRLRVLVNSPALGVSSCASLGRIPCRMVPRRHGEQDTLRHPWSCFHRTSQYTLGWLFATRAPSRSSSASSELNIILESTYKSITQMNIGVSPTFKLNITHDAQGAMQDFPTCSGKTYLATTTLSSACPDKDSPSPRYRPAGHREEMLGAGSESGRTPHPTAGQDAREQEEEDGESKRRSQGSAGRTAPKQRPPRRPQDDTLSAGATYSRRAPHFQVR
ncbi:hypothetical protein OE88DRAFT_1485676 [Heliocybe sulcata]|uniref:Uncharacterized protein n=1 Tax=Heliocybe sulcata TaxID=5364 RepID=A0A5C3N604_9AGAM|nr:hypothetical protein OE88DRAFT_1485676 [Heliocybe sulcata]